MGAWGTGAFDNDTAWEWSTDLADAEDLTLVHETLRTAEDVEDDELDDELCLQAIAACEVIARLLGRPRAAEPDEIDQWVRSRRLKPTAELIRIATRVIDRLAADGSELARLWRSDPTWVATVQDLRRRIAGLPN